MTINRTNIGEHLLRYQIELVGKNWEDTQTDDLWFYSWTLSEEQYRKFRGYAIPLIKKIFKCNRRKAESTFEWFYSAFGLKIKKI